MVSMSAMRVFSTSAQCWYSSRARAFSLRLAIASLVEGRVSGGITDSAFGFVQACAFISFARPFRTPGSTRGPAMAIAPFVPASALQSHLVAAFLTRIDQPDRELPMPRRVDEVLPQHNSADTGMRAEIRRRIGP